MDGQGRDYQDEIADAAQVFITKAIERSEGTNPLHLAELAIASRGKHYAWLKDILDIVNADGRLRQQGNTFKIVPGVNLSAPLSSQVMPEGEVTAETKTAATTVQPRDESLPRMSQPPPAVMAIPTWTSEPAPAAADELPEEDAFLSYVSSNKAIRVGSVSTDQQLLSFVARYCHACPPVSAFRSWWKGLGGETSAAAATPLLARLAHLSFVRIEVSSSSSTKKLVWDVNALAKYAAEKSAAPAPTAGAAAGWTPAGLETDVSIVKKMLLHQLKMFAFYRIQNIHRTVEMKRQGGGNDPAFDLNRYVDHIVHELEKDKRLVLTTDESGVPAFTWADKSKLAHVLTPSVAASTAAPPVPASEGAKRPRDKPVESNRSSWDPADADKYDKEGFYFQSDDPTNGASPKRRRLHEVRQPVYEWYEPPRVLLPSTMPERPVVVDSVEAKVQTQRANFLRQNVEVPYQAVPELGTKRIALDFEEH
ncbi:Aste57867_3744 [Aphanomyces stellatus]|uniref:Aste57867_3744 protein n=1 Tax=Aphanomyces stellatus TaxID=120398 RepID=A0A485KBA7_9STRA|nr:hypothetical protein As57867_003733 [Aphanomyces stellatus]VFT80896.1 Aste57867_3744 [Aphanomyces stellatus]